MVVVTVATNTRLLALLTTVASDVVRVVVMLCLGDLLMPVVFGTGGLGVKVRPVAVAVETELFLLELVVGAAAIEAEPTVTGSTATLVPGDFQSFLKLDVVGVVDGDDDIDALFFLLPAFVLLAEPSAALTLLLLSIAGKGKLDLSAAC
jgi:hypothetical protein